MKGFVTVLLCAMASSAMADNLVCTGYGYTPNPEDFHSIKVDPIEPYMFTVTNAHITTQVGAVYSKVDPSIVGFEELDVAAYVDSGNHHVLYIYKNGKNTEVGISALVDDSDTMYGDKELFTQCSSKPLVANK